MTKLLQFLQGHPKLAFSEKVQRGDQEKFFKNRPKSSHRLKDLKALWRKWHYLPISMLFKLQRLEKILVQKAAPKVPEWQSYGKFRKIHPKPAFF